MITLQYYLAKLVRRSVLNVGVRGFRSSALDSHKKCQNFPRWRLSPNTTTKITKRTSYASQEGANDSDESGIRTHALSDRRGTSLLLEGDLKTAP